MKKHLLVLATMVAAGLVFNACNKDENLTSSNQELMDASDDLATAQDLYQGTEDEINESLEERGPTPTGPDCRTVTITPADGSFPRTVVIDFGTDGCEGLDGRVRRGQIVINQSDSLRIPGAVRTATLVDYYVDDAHVEGTKTWTNTGVDGEGNITLTRKIENAKITFPDGSSITWESNHVLTQTEGGATPTRLDDVMEISGTSSGITRHGVAFSNVISDSDPLVKRASCLWIESGTLEMTVGTRTRSIDYGNGTCDRFAALTLANGQTYTIRIRTWWH